MRSRTEVKERVIFLIENKIQKGRLALLYQLYESEINSLSLAGAAKIISRDLGCPIGIQTIRTLRNKSRDFERNHRTEWEKKNTPTVFSPIQSREQEKGMGIAQPDMEGFKPLDVFSEEFLKKQSTIKWAKPTNA